MKKSSCELLLHYYPKVTEVDELRSTYIANCVFNTFLSYSAIMLNIVTIHAIRKTSSLPNTLKTLLLNLAVSDIGVGLLVQPLYTSLLVKWLQQNNTGCNTYMLFVIITSSFYQASFFGVVALSVDRFLAIHLHLRYQELVTHKRVVAVVISMWLFSLFLPLMMVWVPLSVDIFLLIKFTLGVIGLLLTTAIYISIYFAVRRLKNQIRALQVEQAEENSEIANFARLIKSAVSIFYVYITVLVCYAPHFISLVSLKINGPTIALHRFFLLSLILVFLNSSLNPVIYCWKMRQIRQTLLNILRNMSFSEHYWAWVNLVPPNKRKKLGHMPPAMKAQWLDNHVADIYAWCDLLRRFFYKDKLKVLNWVLTGTYCDTDNCIISFLPLVSLCDNFTHFCHTWLNSTRQKFDAWSRLMSRPATALKFKICRFLNRLIELKSWKQVWS